MPDFDLDSALQAQQVPVECKYCGEPLGVNSFQQLGNTLTIHVICPPCNSEFRWANDFKLCYARGDDGMLEGTAICPGCGSRGHLMTLTKDDRTSVLMQQPADELITQWRCRQCGADWKHKFNFVRAEPDDQI